MQLDATITAPTSYTAVFRSVSCQVNVRTVLAHRFTRTIIATRTSLYFHKVLSAFITRQRKNGSAMCKCHDTEGSQVGK